MELDERDRAALASPSCRWLATGAQREVFNDRLKKDDLGGAWLTLNSSGWKMRDATKAIQRLERKASEPGFSRWSRAWQSVPAQGDY
jgi:hypothetical protein